MTITLDEQLNRAALWNWWLSAFTPAQRLYIEDRYDRLGSAAAIKRSVAEGDAGDRSPARLLIDLSTAFRHGRDRDLALRMLEEAESEAADVLDRHDVYKWMIKLHYEARESRESALECCARACEKQIVNRTAFAGGSNS